MNSVFYNFKPYTTQTGTKYTIVRIVNVRVDPEAFNLALQTVKSHALAKGKDGWWILDKYTNAVEKVGEEIFNKLPEDQQSAIQDYLEMTNLQKNS